MKRKIISVFTAFVIIAVMIMPCISYADGDLSKGSKINNFTLEDSFVCGVFSSDVYLFKHDKTGAKVLVLKNDDVNRAFHIGFLTPAEDTGISHVFEHATLGGSEKYPENMFFDVANGTFNTYMNATTSTQTTYFQLASLSDEQLYASADYYLDGVFNPLIMKSKKNFDREAWRYELKSKDAPLTLNGTVYSEMKGALTPINKAYMNSLKLLYPGSNKSANSGGDPDMIPTLTYEDVKNYHDKYYRPSNSLSVIYGNTDYKKYLALLDEYFSKYDGENPIIDDSGYTPITEPVTDEYFVQGQGDKNMLFYLISCDTSDTKEMFGLYQLANFLQSDSAPLITSMTEKMPSVKTSIQFDYASSTKPTLTILFSNVSKGDEDEIIKITNDALGEIAKSGFNQNLIDAKITSIERETLMLPDLMSDQGISVSANIYSLWQLDGNEKNYFDYLDYICGLDGKTLNDTLKSLTAKYLVNPKIYAKITNKNDPELDAKNDEKLRLSLEEKKAHMTDAEIDEILSYNQEKDTKLASSLLEKINVSNVDSLKKSVGEYVKKDYPYTDETVSSVRYLSAESDFDEIVYMKLYDDVSSLDDEAILYLNLYNRCIGLLDTNKHSAAEIYDLVNRYMSGSVSILPTDDKLYYTAELHMLNDDIKDTYDVLYEWLFETKFDDIAKIKSIIDNELTSWENSVVDPDLMIMRMRAQTNERYALNSYLGGLDYYEFLKDVRKTLDLNPEIVTDKLNKVRDTVKNRFGTIMVYAGGKEGCRLNKTYAESFFEKFSDEAVSDYSRNLPIPEGNEAIITNTNVNNNIIYAPFSEDNTKIGGELLVAMKYVNDRYILPYLRDKNGAYGAVGGANRAGICIYSYYDPNLKNTFDFYASLADLLENSALTQDETDRYILSTFSGKVSGASMTATGKVFSYMTEKIFTATPDTNNQINEILLATPESIKACSKYYRHLSENGIIATVGTKADIEENSELYDNIITPFTNDTVRIFYNGERIKSDVNPVIENGRTLVPFRAILEKMGFTVSWDGNERKITVEKGDIRIVLYIDSNEMLVGDTAVIMDTAAKIIDDRTFIPVRAISEAAGCKVDWDESDRCVIISN